MTSSTMIPLEGKAVGIDLGTTYSALAYMDNSNDQPMPLIVPVGEDKPVLPSVVYFDDSQLLVGDFALEQAKNDPARAVMFIKEQMGRDVDGQPWRMSFQGHEHSPESISAAILGHVVKKAQEKIGAIKSAVITVPACFRERQRVATRDAGRIAGLNVLGTLNEPMAAALQFAPLIQADAENDSELKSKLHSDEGLRIAVYDLGGGTFDVTLLQVRPDAIVELTTNGDRKLGGKDWDERLLEYVAVEFQKVHGVNFGAEPLRSSPVAREVIRVPVAIDEFGGGSETEDVTHETSAGPQVRFVTSAGFGVQVKAGGQAKNSVLIPRNTPVPFGVTQRYFTANSIGDATEIVIRVTQGDSEDLSLAETHGTLRISGFSSNQPPGQPVDITFELDEQARLHVRAVYVNTSQVVEANIKVAGGLREEELREHQDILRKQGLITRSN